MDRKKRIIHSGSGAFEFEGNSLNLVHHGLGFIKNLIRAEYQTGTQNGSIQVKSIVSTQKVAEGRYEAENQISLLPRFEATPADKFVAVIDTFPSTYQWQYALSDHLGNLRVLFTDKKNDGLIAQSVNDSINEVLTVRNYSPFGLELGGSHKNLDYQNRYKYGGKELNNFTGLTDFGRRNFDAPLGRFTSQDRFSEKYYSLNTMGYTAGNPINLVDINGDSLWVTTGETGDNFKLYWGYTEKDGFGLYNSKNEIYQGKNKFVNTISRALSLLNLSKEGSSYISKISSMSEDVTISEINARNVTQNNIIYVNPSLTVKSPTQEGNIESPFFITLGHELGHGYANAIGTNFKDWLSIPTINGARTLSSSEIYASHIENIFRSHSGHPLRTHYSPTTDGGVMEETRLLDSRGQSLHFGVGLSAPTDINLNGINNRFKYK